MIPVKSHKKNFQGHRSAITPAISTIILTAVLVVLVLVTATYADNELTLQMAEGEFSSNSNFMQTTGMQIDNVAWTIGRTETIDYTVKYGQVAFAPNVLTYTFEMLNKAGAVLETYTFTTGMVLYNMPASSYSVGNDYFSRIVPSTSSSFVQWNVSSPVYQVFESENIAAYGPYARIITVPTVRVLNSTLNGAGYYEFYLPSLVSATSPYHSESLTLTGSGLSMETPSGNIASVQITATPASSVINSLNPALDFKVNNAFFDFQSPTETIAISSNSLVEIYIGQVTVSIGIT